MGLCEYSCIVVRVIYPHLSYWYIGLANAAQVGDVGLQGIGFAGGRGGAEIVSRDGMQGL